MKNNKTDKTRQSDSPNSLLREASKLALAIFAGALATHAADTMLSGVIKQHLLDLTALIILLMLLALISFLPKELETHRDQIKREVINTFEAAQVDGRYFYNFNKDDHTEPCRDLLARTLNSTTTRVRVILSCRWGEDLQLRLSLMDNLKKSIERINDDCVVIFHGLSSPGNFTTASRSISETLATANPNSTMLLDEIVGPDFLLIDDSHLFILASSSASHNGALRLEGVLHVTEFSQNRLRDKRIIGTLDQQFEHLMRSATFNRRQTSIEPGSSLTQA